MSRTNIDIDDDLIAEFMRDHNVRTKRAAVDLALRLARRPEPMTSEEIIALRGTGFIDPDFDLNAVRAHRTFTEPSADDR